MKYILSIGKKHIIFFILMMFTIFALIFILGIFAGYSIGKKSKIPQTESSLTVTPTLDNYNNFDPTTLSQGVSNSIDDTKFVSQEISIDPEFHERDVLKVNSQNRETMLIPDKSKQKNNSKATSTPSQKPKTTTKKYVDKPVPGVQYYYIQVIATLNVSKAKYIYDQLKVRKYPVKVKKSTKGNQYLYAIRVGLYTNKKLAQRHLRLIRKGGGYTKAFMKSYQINSKPTPPASQLSLTRTSDESSQVIYPLINPNPN